MTIDEVKQVVKEGKAEFVTQPKPEEQTSTEINELTRFMAVLEVLRRPKYHLTIAPTFTPKNFLEQIQFYDDGADQRIYFYINTSWRYTTLT